MILRSRIVNAVPYRRQRAYWSVYELTHANAAYFRLTLVCRESIKRVAIYTPYGRIEVVKLQLARIPTRAYFRILPEPPAALLRAVIGLAIGLVGALALSRLLASSLFGVQPTDPATLAAVSAVVLVVALLASYVPARRAADVDPVSALRTE